jgi:3-hydroxyisobutyrate dehydrogenase-like beta-hydroxyacid dehydrogenase
VSDVLHVGFVGLGDMGAPMARHLVGRGFPTTVTDVRADAVAALVTAGAKPAETPAEVAEVADVIAVCVVDDAQATAVVAGERGLVDRLRAGQTVVLHSSVRPETAVALAEAVRSTGADLLDAPVSGSRPAVEAATLTIMVGGEPATLERARPALCAYAERIFHLGPVGTGQSMKLVNNVMLHLNHLVALEALRLAAAEGIAEADAVEVVNASSGRSWVTETWGLIDDMLRDHPQAGTDAIFPLMSKELWNAVVVGRGRDTALPFTALGTQLSRAYLSERSLIDHSLTDRWETPT